MAGWGGRGGGLLCPASLHLSWVKCIFGRLDFVPILRVGSSSEYLLGLSQNFHFKIFEICFCF